MTNNKKYVLITGATAGIGLEFAKLFYSMKYNLVLVSRNNKRLEEIKDLIKTNENSIDIIQSDLSLKDSAHNLYSKCKSKGIIVDILVNNAGVGLYGKHTELSHDKIEEMITLNILSLTTLCCLFGKDMKERKSGHILNIASTAAYQPLPYLSSYAASKSYVLNFSEALSKEMEDYNVVVTCLSPGPTDTGFFAEAGIGNETGGFFRKKDRDEAKKVAEHGVDVLFKKKISAIPGTKKSLMAWLNRFVPRKTVVNISKSLMKKP